jgi:hypothetical protein
MAVGDVLMRTTLWQIYMLQQETIILRDSSNISTLLPSNGEVLFYWRGLLDQAAACPPATTGSTNTNKITQ